MQGVILRFWHPAEKAKLSKARGTFGRIIGAAKIAAEWLRPTFSKTRFHLPIALEATVGGREFTEGNRGGKAVSEENLGFR